MDATTLRDDVAEMVRGLPPDVSMEDIQYRLYVLDKVRRGRDAIREGHGLSPAEARARLSRWLDA